jgi:hypothetical protein
MSSIYQIKVTLEGTKPPIWRRIQVPADITLYDLHRILQVTMGWTDSHLHQFIIGEKFYGEPDEEFRMEMVDERKTKLNRVIKVAKAKFRYEYDFGDSWLHKLEVGKILEPEPGVHYPRCIKGSRNGPPEDCGGVWGYSELLETIGDPGHPEYADRLEWLDGEFDREAFDIDEVNEVLKQIH